MYSKSLILPLLTFFTLTSAVQASTPTRTGQPELTFEKNLGQHDPRVDFVVSSHGFTGFLTDGDVHFALEPSEPGAPPSGLVLEVLGGEKTTARGSGPLVSRSNYLEGSDPKRWIRNVPHFAEVRYPAIYPGIEMVYRSSQGALQYDFRLAPGADPNRVGLAFHGAKSLELDGEGRLLVETASGQLVQPAPIAFQLDAHGERRPVEVAFALTDDKISFELGAWDPERELVIDPPLHFSTFLGRDLVEWGNDVAVDIHGNHYVVGWTYSASFPVTAGAYQTVKSGGPTQANLFLTKIDPSGTTVIYSTFLGANTRVLGEAVVVDEFEQAYVLADAGPLSTLYTSPNAVQGTVGLSSHTYVAKFNDAGSNILYGSFLSGSSGSTPGDVAVDSIGNIYVAGNAPELSFPRLNAFQPTMAGVSDAYFVKVDPMAPSSLLYATFLGGNSTEAPDSIAVDAAGIAYLTGYTRSANFPTWQPIQLYQGASDAFATAIDAGLSGQASLIYSTFLGGSGEDNLSKHDGGVAVDDLGFATYGGATQSSNFPVTGGVIQPFLSGLEDAFVVRLDPSGNMVFATYFGGSGIDKLRDLAVDSTGRIALFGYTTSSDLPIWDAFQPTKTNSADLFLTVLAPNAATLEQSSFLGGNSSYAEHAGGVAFYEPTCQLIAAGHTEAGTPPQEFPTTSGSLQPVHGGATDAFLLSWPYCTPNQPPTANTDEYTTWEDQQLQVFAPGVLLNDTDPENDPLSIVTFTQPLHGFVTMTIPGGFTYNPDPNYFGPDSFTYDVSDGQLTSTGLINIEVKPVNDPPTALPDNAGTLIQLPVAIDVRANDSDIELDPLTVIAVAQPANGTTSILPNGDVEYVSNAGFVGVDSFLYTISDPQGETDSALVTVGVEPGPMQVAVDVLPAKCPNPISLRGEAIHVAIVSSSTFDAASVDTSTIDILGVTPFDFSITDLATPYVPYIGKSLATDCHAVGPDGLEDLSMFFDRASLLTALAAANGPLSSGQVHVLELNGNLVPALNGIAIVGEDVITIQ